MNMNEHHDQIVQRRTYHILLTAIFEHRLLSVDQATRLLYKPGMLTTVRERLYFLANTKNFHDDPEQVYLLRHALPTKDIGNKPAFYSLAGRGRSYFQEQGFNVKKRYRPVEERELGYPTIMHLLGLNDVTIALRLLPKQLPALRIARWFMSKNSAPCK